MHFSILELFVFFIRLIISIHFLVKAAFEVVASPFLNTFVANRRMRTDMFH